MREIIDIPDDIYYYFEKFWMMGVNQNPKTDVLVKAIKDGTLLSDAATNEDKIKSMTTEELASFLDDIRNNFSCDKFCNEEHNGCGWSCDHSTDKDFFLTWLKEGLHEDK